MPSASSGLARSSSENRCFGRLQDLDVWPSIRILSSATALTGLLNGTLTSLQTKGAEGEDAGSAADVCCSNWLQEHQSRMRRGWLCVRSKSVLRSPQRVRTHAVMRHAGPLLWRRKGRLTAPRLRSGGQARHARFFCACEVMGLGIPCCYTTSITDHHHIEKRCSFKTKC
jgi:hypothetical protein